MADASSLNRIRVQVRPDHLASLSTVRKPLLAVAELIWNGLDADATRISVRLRHNRLSGLSGITVTDNGHGMPQSDAKKTFGSLGGSWKRADSRSHGGRLLHGKAGKGRFRAFFLGKRVVWDTHYEKDGKTYTYKMHGEKQTLGTFEYEDERPSTRKSTGTEVRIREVERNFRSLEGDRAIQEVTEFFALYLEQYKHVRITYDGRVIDPDLVVASRTNIDLGEIEIEDGLTTTASLTIIEWIPEVERRLFLCDANGIALDEASPGIQAMGFNFTAYLKSDYIKALDKENGLGLPQLHPGLRALHEAAKPELKAYFREKQAEQARSAVEKWKEEEVYPYEGDPKTIIEETERQVFDVVALNVQDYLHEFEDAGTQSRRFSFRLLREAIEDSPEALQRIIQDVLDLPARKQADLASLLKRTTLTAVINASKAVADRLDFLRALEILVFDPKSKRQLLERSQLHKILEERTWLFGEEFALSASDKGLTEVLDKHLGLLGREPRKGGAPVLRADDGKKGIVDLMLSRAIRQTHEDEVEHLIVELKRPSQKIDTAAASQIEEYAVAVAEDERFRDTKTKWVFWVLSNEVTPTVRRRTRQRNRPEGILFDDEELRITVWVKTWAQIIRDCTARLEFYRKKLEYVADDDSALATLRSLHAKYLPPVILERLQDGEGDG